MLIVSVLVFAGGLLADVSDRSAASMVIFAALTANGIAQVRRLARFRRSELVSRWPPGRHVGIRRVYGVVVAVVLSILELLRRLAHAHDSVLGFVPGIAGMHDIDDYPGATRVSGLVVYRYDAPLCFANAEDFRTRALAAVYDNPEPVEWFLLNAESNVEVDLTALDALDQLRVELSRRGIVFAMAEYRTYVSHCKQRGFWTRSATIASS